MMLPESCSADVIYPKTSFSISDSNNWASTDVVHSFTLSKRRHVIIMYQYSGFGNNAYIAMRLSLNSVTQPHTISVIGNTQYIGNFGLWQGPLKRGKYTAAVHSPFYHAYITKCQSIHNIAHTYIKNLS